MTRRLHELLPDLSRELEQLLNEAGEPGLAAQVPGLEIIHPTTGMLILDVVSDVIAYVEVLYRDDVRRKLMALLP